MAKLFIFDDSAPLDPARCLRGGVGGAVLRDAPAGSYVIVVDGPAGSGASHDMTVTCEPLLPCGGSPPTIGCNGGRFASYSRPRATKNY